MSKGARQVPLFPALMDGDIILAPSYLVFAEVVERDAQTNKEGRKEGRGSITALSLCLFYVSLPILLRYTETDKMRRKMTVMQRDRESCANVDLRHTLSTEGLCSTSFLCALAHLPVKQPWCCLPPSVLVTCTESLQ